jgi:hypothetical protein
MAEIQEFTRHHARVLLHMEPSPDGSCMAFAAAVETLRYLWIGTDEESYSRGLLSICGGGVRIGKYRYRTYTSITIKQSRIYVLGKRILPPILNYH